MFLSETQKSLQFIQNTNARQEIVQQNEHISNLSFRFKEKKFKRTIASKLIINFSATGQDFPP